jgi:DNA-binding response OmpR family regulator
MLDTIVEILSNDYQIDSTTHGDEGLFLAQQNIYDCIILDVMLPEKNGFDIVKQLRNDQIKTPVLFLTAKDSLEDRVHGLNLGADDYLVKPFQAAELTARVHALLRRSGSLTIEKTVKFLGIELLGKENPILVNGEDIKLTSKQYELIEYLIHNNGKILTREQIFDRVWGYDSDTTIGIVEVYVHQLRKKFEPFAYDQCIKTVRGIGYILREN